MKKLYITLIALFLVASCDILEFDDSINNSPNSPSEAAAQQLLANAMMSLSGISSSTTGEFLGQYLSETQYVVASQYPSGGSSFYGWYQGPLINLESVLTGEFKTVTSENQLAVAKILKAYYFWHLTDRWGDVPFTESLKGGENITPVYDTQQSIYNNLFALLKEADAQIDVNATLPSDLIYSGDMSKWKKLGNTIRMLMALRLSEIDAVKGKAEFNLAVAAGVMSSNSDSFAYNHLADANNQNYWYGQIEVDGREWWALTKTLVDLMEPYSDPRLAVYGDPARTSGNYVGLPIGSAAAAANTEAFSLLGTAIRAQDAPVYLVTYAQVLFAKAEAKELTWITEDAETNYNAAIEQSFLQWTGSTAGLAAFMADPDIAYDAARAVEQIATQRYVHLFMHGYEAWAEWRRTGFPAFALSAGNAVPLRQSYTETESFNNTENYNEAVQRQFGGTDGIYEAIWWDN